MSTIRVGGLVMTDAEDVLAKMWCGLEKYKLRTPQVKVDPVPDGTIDLRISFKHARDADLIRRVLAPLRARLLREHCDLRSVDILPAA